MTKIVESFNKATEHLHIALNQTQHAFIEVYKWQHPVGMEISGLTANIQNKINRLKKLTQDLETKGK
jgi:hypothetical protein